MQMPTKKTREETQSPNPYLNQFLWNFSQPEL